MAGCALTSGLIAVSDRGNKRINADGSLASWFPAGLTPNSGPSAVAPAWDGTLFYLSVDASGFAEEVQQVQLNGAPLASTVGLSACPSCQSYGLVVQPPASVPLGIVLTLSSSDRLFFFQRM